ncbi:MAG: diacylglycerol kinase family protein [Minisyncoccia bacterium]
MKATCKSFNDAVRGLKVVFKEERNFKIEIFISIAVLIFARFFNFDIYEIIPLVIVIFMVITAEIINTAVEDLCNIVEPNQSPKIGKIKDITASYVLVSVISAVVVGLLVVCYHFNLI